MIDNIKAKRKCYNRKRLERNILNPKKDSRNRGNIEGFINGGYRFRIFYLRIIEVFQYYY